MAAAGVLLAHRLVKGQTSIGAPLSWYGWHSLQVALAHIMICVGGSTLLIEVGFDPFDSSLWFHSFGGLVVLLPAFYVALVIPSRLKSFYFSCYLLRQSLMVPTYPVAAMRWNTQGRMWRGRIPCFHITNQLPLHLLARQSRELWLIN